MKYPFKAVPPAPARRPIKTASLLALCGVTVAGAALSGASPARFSVAGLLQSWQGGTRLARSEGPVAVPTGQPVVTSPVISIEDVAIAEGASGTKNAVFIVSLSDSPASTLSVKYATANGSATAGSDYTAVSGTLTFAANATTLSQAILVPIAGDATIEPTELFKVNLSAPVNGTLGVSSATGAIVTDDIGRYGGKIAFISDRTGQDEVFIMNADGSSQRPLTTTGGGAPSLSPDGTRIAYTADSGDVRQIFVMNADGTDQHAITTGNEPKNSPAISTDGTRVAYSQELESGLSQIYVVPLAGGTPAPVTDSTVGSYSPNWSRDDARVLFDTDRDGSNFEINAIPRNGSDPGDVINLTNRADVDDFGPTASPVDDTVAWYSDRDTTPVDLYFSNADGTNPRRALATPYTEGRPDFSPDGKLLVFDSNPSANFDIYKWPLTGGAPLRLTTDAGVDFSPSWSIGEVTDIPSLVVTTTSDVVDNGDQKNTLREAIQFANSKTGADTITFAIPSGEAVGGVWTIKPTAANGPLPALNKNTAVTGGTTINAVGKAVVLDGSLLTTGAPNGLTITGSDATVKGLTIQNFGGSGILVNGSAQRITIGGTAAGEANTIAGNSADGVTVTEAAGAVRIRGNSITANSGLGINLLQPGESGSAVTSNDALDGDSGPNTLQNYPTISGVKTDPANAANTRIDFALNSKPATGFVFDLYANADTELPGFGQGRKWLATTAKATGAVGTAAAGTLQTSISIPTATLRAAGSLVSLTATRGSLTAPLDTSEFSQTQSIDLPSGLRIDPLSGVPGTPVTISGSNLLGITNIRFSGDSDLVATADFQLDTNSSGIVVIRTKVPAGALTGPVTLSGAGRSDRSLQFTVDSNDRFYDAYDLSPFGAAGSIRGTNLYASANDITKTPNEVNEPSHANFPASKSVWYRWTAAASISNMTFDTRGSDYNTRIQIYTPKDPLTGNLTSDLTKVAFGSDNDAPGLTTDRAIFNAVGGTTYYIAVDGVGSAGTKDTPNGQQGLITLNWAKTNSAAPSIRWNLKDSGGNGLSGVWTDADNWLPQRVPVPGDYVAIDLPGTYTVLLDSSPVIQGIVLGPATGGNGTQTLDLNAKTLSLTSLGSRVNPSGLLILRGGETLANKPNLSIAGTLDWRGGTLKDYPATTGGTVSGTTTIETGGRLLLSETATVKTLSQQVLINNGTVTWKGAAVTGQGNLKLINDAKFRNRALFELQTDADVLFDTGNGDPEFINDGAAAVLRKSGPAGITECAAHFSNLDGAVEIVAGTLSVSGKGTGRGAFRIAGGALLECKGEFEFENASLGRVPTASGVGSVKVVGRLVQLLPTRTLTIKDGITMQVPTGSVLAVNGTYTQSAGDTFLAGGGINAGGTGATVNLNGGTLSGTGTVTGKVTVKSGATIDPRSATLTRAGPDVGNINISGSLSMEAGSALVFDVKGVPTPTSNTDRIILSGDCSLNGAVIVQPLQGSGFVFTNIPKFDIIRAASFSGGAAGNFVKVTLPPGIKGSVQSNFAAGSAKSYVIEAGDVAPPAVTIAAPVDKSFIKALPTLSGTATDASGVEKVDVTLKRNSDSKFWNGATWVAASTPLSATVGAGTWSKSTGLPAAGADAATQLLEGAYTLGVTAVDKNNLKSPAATATFTIDRTVPLVGFTNVSNNGSVKTLVQVSGTDSDTGGSGIARVTMDLKRNNDGLFWDGAKWSAVKTALTTSLTANGWLRNSGMPANGPNLDTQIQEGAYVLSATATDKAGNSSVKASASVKLDNTVPASVAITTPAPNATNIKSIPNIIVAATDNAGGGGIGSVTLKLRHTLSPNVFEYWTQDAVTKLWDWKTPSVAFPTQLTGNGWQSGFNLPAGTRLPTEAQTKPGDYLIAATATDKGGNIKSASFAFTVAAPAPVLAPVRSAVLLSSLRADSATGTVTLTFTSALATATAADPARYTVTLNGVPATIESAALSSAGRVVTLELESVSAGAAVTVVYDLSDSSGRQVPGTAKVTAK